MYLLFVALLVLGLGVMQHSMAMGAWIIVFAIYAGGKAAQMTDGDDWIMSILFLIGIISVPVIILWVLIL